MENNKTFNIVKPEKRSYEQTVYEDFICDNYLMKTFCDKKVIRPDYIRVDGADWDYSWIANIKKDDINDIAKIVNEVHEETGSTKYQPAFMLGSPYGVDYDDPFAKQAQQLFTPENGYDVFNEIWYSADLKGQDGSDEFYYNSNVQKHENEFSIERIGLKDAKILADIYNRSINGEGSVFQSDIDTLSYTNKILAIKDPKLEIFAYIARHIKTGKVAGFKLVGTDGEHVYANDTGIDPEFRRMGLYGLLHKRCVADMKKLGARDIWCDTQDQHPINGPLHDNIGYKKRFLSVKGWTKNTNPEKSY